MKKILLILSCILFMGFAGCSNTSNSSNASNPTNAIVTPIATPTATPTVTPKATPTVTPKATPTPVKLKAQAILDKLKETEGKYMVKITVVTAENDSNKLLGRPNQYTEKITWKDNRIQDSDTDSSIELFANKEDAAARKTYLESVTKSMPMFVQYIVQKDNILLRIEGGLTPTQSDEYTKIFNALK